MKHIRFVIISCCTLLSAMIGAGFASGQEMIQFFARFHPSTTVFILIAAASITFITMRFFQLAKKNACEDWQELFLKTMPSPLGKIAIHWMTISFLIMSAAMLSAANDLTHQFWGWPKPFGSLIMILITLLIFQSGFASFMRLSSVITIILILCLLVASWYEFEYLLNLKSTDSVNFYSTLSEFSASLVEFPSNHLNFISAFKDLSFLYPIWFAAYNVTLTLGVLVAIQSFFKERTFYGTYISIGTALGMSSLLAMGCFLLLRHPEKWSLPLPLASVIEMHNPLSFPIFPMLLFLEILSTYLAGMFSILLIKKTTSASSCTSRFEKMKPYLYYSFTAITAWLPFHTWVSKLYPLIGIGCTAILCLILFNQRSALDTLDDTSRT